MFAKHEYRHINTKLDLDDVIVIYGNGFAQSEFPDGSIVGHNKLIESLRDSPHTLSHARLAHLIGLIQQDNPPEHDSTIVVCRVTNSRVRLRDNLLAPLRFFQRPRDDTQLT